MFHNLYELLYECDFDENFFFENCFLIGRNFYDEKNENVLVDLEMEHLVHREVKNLENLVVEIDIEDQFVEGIEN